MKGLRTTVLLGAILAGTGYLSEAQGSTTVCDGSGCVITVDWAIDVEPDSSTATCDYTQGGLFRPDTTGEGAGKCSLRRAIREAGARSDESLCPGCSPITIQFTGLDGTNGDDDDANFDDSNSQWTLPLDGNATPVDHWQLRGQSILDTEGQITIAGPSYNTQTQMPRIFVDTTQSLEIELSDVTVENLGFIGGMGVVFKEPNGVFRNNSWGLSQDGMSIVFTAPSTNPARLAGVIGVSNNLDGDNLLVENNRFAGAATKAIEIRAGSSGSMIRNNRIGLRLDDTVPDVPDNLACRGFGSITNPGIDPSEWFGGWGIAVAGTGTTIMQNQIAGLQNIRSFNDTPPMAIEVFGAAHLIDRNLIGAAFPQGVLSRYGVCGQGIKFSVATDPLDPMSFGHVVTGNFIIQARNGFENTEGAILWSDTSLPPNLNGGTTLTGNIVENGPERYFEMGPMIATATKNFEPAEITSFNGGSVSGRASVDNGLGVPSPCPNCIIDFYVDDFDANEEALAYAGQTTADGNGNFVDAPLMLPGGLPSGFGIRTTSTSQADGVIPNTFAGTTSELSRLIYAPVVAETLFSDGFESP